MSQSQIRRDAPAFAPAAQKAYIEPMPKGPQGQKRPADAVGAAIRVARIATGEEEETPAKDLQKSEIGRLGGQKRAQALTKDERSAIAKKAAESRNR